MIVRNGFTLVELLAAMLGASLLLVALSLAIRQLTERYRSAAAIDAVEQVETVAPFLTAELSRMRPPTRGTPFRGDETHLSAIVPPPLALGAASPVRLDLTVEGRSDGDALVARVESLDGDTLPPAATAPAILARGFRSIRMNYLRRAGDGAEVAPRLVTIQFTAKAGVVLPLGVAPRITEPADCFFDAIAMACRR